MERTPSTPDMVETHFSSNAKKMRNSKGILLTHSHQANGNFFAKNSLKQLFDYEYDYVFETTIWLWL